MEKAHWSWFHYLCMYVYMHAALLFRFQTEFASEVVHDACFIMLRIELRRGEVVLR